MMTAKKRTVKKLDQGTKGEISPRGTPLKFGWNRGGVVLSRKPAISLKRGKI